MVKLVLKFRMSRRLPHHAYFKRDLQHLLSRWTLLKHPYSSLLRQPNFSYHLASSNSEAFFSLVCCSWKNLASATPSLADLNWPFYLHFLFSCEYRPVWLSRSYLSGVSWSLPISWFLPWFYNWPSSSFDGVLALLTLLGERNPSTRCSLALNYTYSSFHYCLPKFYLEL